MSTTVHIANRPAIPRRSVVGKLTIILLYTAFYLYQVSQRLFGAIALALATGIAIIFGVNRYYGARFIFPGGRGGADRHWLCGDLYDLHRVCELRQL